MFKLIAFLKHLLTATNHHGVHSPFVYDYLTKCLYKKPNHKISKSVNIILKSIAYFKIESIHIISGNRDIEKQIQQKLGLQLNRNPPFDLVYTENPSAVQELITDKVHNDTLIFIDNIQKNQTYYNSWEELKNRNEFTVSIDFFHCGILFLREEQVKEHFKIRI